ncbi:hypothetical protein CVD28_08880 [Bacillus sp. M6-12]|uniref:hypothetical protein n=1 Tax=Bacillus sp. M6-12 TaxID=2054166 RepID=UPI000C762CFF|nr:hypothetical protein [Bacillus sp. M6-12]PLS17804.1 hypothetical protein CVD28_08880 [Bacillus sp. M6-12]
MKIRSIRKCVELEVFDIHIKRGFTIIIEVFNRSNDYVGFAMTTYQKYECFTGVGYHKNQKECALAAYNDLLSQISRDCTLK